MDIALAKNGARTCAKDADYTNEFFCQSCGESLILKRGEIRRPHFSHRQGTFCRDSWHYDMSEWHQSWQEQFPIENREIVFEKNGKKHRADIFVDGAVIEFQHSPISYDEFNERNRFYRSLGIKVIWIFDVVRNSPEYIRDNKKGNGAIYAWERPLKNLRGFEPKNPMIKVFLQIDLPVWERCGIEIPLRKVSSTEQIRELEAEMGGTILSIDWISPKGFYRFATNYCNHYNEAEILHKFAKLPLNNLSHLIEL